jgi:hypothetical protein
MLDTASLIQINDNDLGNVVCAYHDDDTGALPFHVDNTNYTHNPVTKGQDVSLNLAGIVSDDIDVKTIRYYWAARFSGNMRGILYARRKNGFQIFNVRDKQLLDIAEKNEKMT